MSKQLYEVFFILIYFIRRKDVVGVYGSWLKAFNCIREWYKVCFCISWGCRVGGWWWGRGLHRHSNRSRCGTAVAHTVMAFLARRPAAPSSVFFMSPPPSLSALFQRKLLHIIWILLHDGEQNTRAQLIKEALWLADGRPAFKCLT